MGDTKKFDFICNNCDFVVKFDYFGKTPSFAKSITILENAYLMKDPFTDENKCIILGSHCTICNHMICISQDCSLFYKSRFCLKCVGSNIEEFPKEIQIEANKKLQTVGAAF